MVILSRLELQERDYYFTKVEQFVTTCLMTTLLMLFVVFSDTLVVPAGRVDQNGRYKTTTV